MRRLGQPVPSPHFSGDPRRGHHAAPAPAHHAAPIHRACPPPSTAPAQTANPIPQNNGGDQDADNNGGPSDGDGNI